MKDYSIKIVDGHHVVDMSHKPSEFEVAMQRAILSYSNAIKIVADGIQKKWGMK